MQEFSFPSSSGPKVYTTRINDNGLLSCDCMGWTSKREGKPRHCKHTKLVAQEQRLVLQERDGQMFVASGVAPVAPVAAPVAPIAAAAPTVVRVAPVVEVAGGVPSPMLASKMPAGRTADYYGADGGFVMEEKYDGHRMIVRVGESGEVQAWSRLGNARTLPAHLGALMRDMPHGLYDGELIVPGMKSYGVVAGINSGQEMLILFDALEILGQNVMKESQENRRVFLDVAYGSIGDDEAMIQLSYQCVPSVAAVQEIWDRGGEGAIIKRLGARYRPGWRSPDWIKVKANPHAVLTITGFKEGKSGPYSSTVLVDDGGIETTVKTKDNKTLRSIAANPGAYIGQRLVVSYHERTPDGNYRHPMWDHISAPHET